MELLKREMEGKKGIILIMALWIMTILSVVAVSFAFMMRTEMKMAGNYRNGVKAHYLALAGVEHAIAAILNDATNDISEGDYTDHYGEAWHEEFRTNWVPDPDVTWDAKEFDCGGGTYAVHLSDENSKLNLNYANASGVWDLMATDGIDDVYFHRKTCNILDYRDGTWSSPFTNEWGTGNTSYEGQLGHEGAGCKDNFFDTVYEIQKVTGINFGDNGVYDNPLDENPGRGSELDMTVYSQDRNRRVDGTLRTVDVKTATVGEFESVGFSNAEATLIVAARTGFVDYGYPLVGDPPTTMGVGAAIWNGTGGSLEAGLSDANVKAAMDKMTCGNYDSGIIKGTVNINTGTPYGLRGLFNIGVGKAPAIITERNTNGPFAHRGLIMNAPGIDRGIFQDCADLITVRSDRFRIYSTGTFGSAVRRIEAVVDRDGNQDGTKGDVKVLYWSEKVFED